jgi:hypothetical protein
MKTPAKPRERRSGWPRRGPSEAVSMALIGGGIVMLMQPFWLVLYTWSFIVILAGTVGFVVGSHLRD